MTILSFPTVKLKKYIRRINTRVKDLEPTNEKLVVYGVTNTDGIVITGNQVSEDLGSYIVIKENQFAYNPYRINVGSIGLVPQVTTGIVSPAYIVFETNEDLDSRFLLYYLKSSLGLRLIRWYGDRGGVRAALRYNDLENIDIPKMSVEQQNQFLNKVQVVEVQINSLNCSIEQQKNYLVRLRQSVLQEAVQGKLVPQDPNDDPANELLKKIQAEKELLIKENKIKKEKPLPPIKDEEIPYELRKGWEWVRLGEISTIKGGKRLPAGHSLLETPTDHIYIRVTDMKNHTINDSNLRFISDEAYKQIKDYIIEKYDLYIVIVGSTIGKVGIVPEVFHEMNLTENAARIIIIKCEKRFILNALASDYMQGQFVEKTNQLGQPKLALIRLRLSLLPFPSLNEQQRIAAKVDQLMQLCDELETSITQAQKDSEQLMQAVLQEAFGGNKTETVEKKEILLDSIS